MSPLMTVAEAHAVAVHLKKQVMESLPYVNDVDFHLEFFSSQEENPLPMRQSSPE